MQPRVCLSSIAKVSGGEKIHEYYGYIENISESGLGMVSPDVIPEGSRMVCHFFLEGVAKKLSPEATLVYVRNGEDRTWHYGFRFDAMSPEDRELIRAYIRRNNP